MNTLLMVVAGLLTLATIVAFFVRPTGGGANESRSLAVHCRLFLTALVVVGTLFALGGFWLEWCIWGGIILVEAGCLGFILWSPAKRQ